MSKQNPNHSAIAYLRCEVDVFEQRDDAGVTLPEVRAHLDNGEVGRALYAFAHARRDQVGREYFAVKDALDFAEGDLIDARAAKKAAKRSHKKAAEKAVSKAEKRVARLTAEYEEASATFAAFSRAVGY
jgi:hypothetical protein